MPDTIVKLVYRRNYFDIEQMRPGAKEITTITDDGIIVIKEYAAGSRKACSVKETECSVQAFADLCESIIACIAGADRLDAYCDDSSEELIIYHKYGRIQTMDRGLGNEFVHIGEVMNAFLCDYPPDRKG